VRTGAGGLAGASSRDAVPWRTDERVAREGAAERTEAFFFGGIFDGISWMLMQDFLMFA